MNDKKNIERLFQEKFKDFEATPSPKVWENIAAELEKKEDKKRILPFWFNMKAAGIAATLLLGYFIANNSGFKPFNSNENNTKTVVSSESSTSSAKADKNANDNLNVTTNDNLNNSKNNAVVVTENNQNGVNSTSNAAENAVVSNENDKQNSAFKGNKNIKYINKNQKMHDLDEVVVNASIKKTKRSKSVGTSKYNTTEIGAVNKSNEQVADNGNNELKNSSEQNKKQNYSDIKGRKSKLKKATGNIYQNTEEIVFNGKNKKSKSVKSNILNQQSNQEES